MLGKRMVGRRGKKIVRPPRGSGRFSHQTLASQEDRVSVQEECCGVYRVGSWLKGNREEKSDKKTEKLQARGWNREKKERSGGGSRCLWPSGRVPTFSG